MISIIHPTEMCNQHCTYCVNYKGTDVMSIDTLVNSIEFISHIQDGNRDHVEFHSVEPTLRGLPFFVRAEELLTEFGVDTKRLLASNTTSDVWCNNIDEWCRFLSDNDWAMNISLDGSERIHDRNRGQGTWNKVINSLINIKEHDIGYGIISVITHGDDLNEVYDFFVGINEPFQINPTLPINDMGAAMCDLFNRWITDHKPLKIEPFTKIFKYFTGQYYIKECPNICAHDLVSISPNGDVRPCGFFWDNTDLRGLYIYGNVNTDKFDDIWYGAERQKMLEYVDCIPADCMVCHWIDFCGTGCSYAKHAGADKCGYMKELLDHAAWIGGS